MWAHRRIFGHLCKMTATAEFLDTYVVMAAVPGILRQWNPGIVPNLQLWVDGSDKSTFAFTNESNINTIRDKSGNSVILTQGTQVNQPLISCNINGRQTVSFLPNVYMSTTTSNFVSKFNNNAQESQFLIVRLQSLSSNNVITYMGNESATDYQQYEYDSIPQGGIASNISLRVDSSNIPNSFVLNKGNVTCNVFFMDTYFNNVAPRQFSFNVFVDSNPSLIITTNAPNPGFNIINYDNFYIGKSFYIPTNTQSFNGDLGEIVMFTSNYSSDLQYKPQVEGYLAWKWGLQSFLSNGHPYKNRNPS